MLFWAFSGQALHGRLYRLTMGTAQSPVTVFVAEVMALESPPLTLTAKIVRR